MRRDILVVTDNLVFADWFSNWEIVDYSFDVYCSADDINNTGLRELNINSVSDQKLGRYHAIISAHCLTFFSSRVVNNFWCINIHPGYLPLNRGWYTHVFAIANSYSCGVTIHRMDEKLDNGPIYVRKIYHPHQHETGFDVYHVLLKLEIEMVKECLQGILDGYTLPIKCENEKSLYTSSKDFSSLCVFRGDEVLNFKSFFDRMRALSHPPYNNCFLLLDNGDKVHFRLEILE